MAAVVPLEFARPGKDVIIKEVAGGMGIRRRLTDLGLVKGARAHVVRNDGFGPLILALGDGVSCCRLAIGRGMAHKIMVEEREPVDGSLCSSE